MNGNQSAVIQNVDLSELANIVAIDKETFGKDSYSYFVFRQFFDCFGKLFKIAVIGNKTVGYIVGGKKLDTNLYYILSIAVLDDYKKFGIGSMLIREFVQTIHSQGINTIQLTVAPKNRAATSFYQKHGFLLVSNEKDYYGPGEDRLVFEMTTHS